jgi:pimeloyl-ACP methyl ester carboxylesterase
MSTAWATAPQAVILDSGLGDSFYSWRKVQSQIAEFTEVCSYDRAGFGYSDHSPLPRRSQIFAEELAKLLVNAQIPRPYILVGHSLGGANIRVYASENLSSVAGMILVDSVHPDQWNRLPAAIWKIQQEQGREAKKFEWEALFGIPRLKRACGSDPRDIALNCTFESGRTWAAEIALLRESLDDARPTGPFGDLPLTVLSHDPEKLIEEFPPELRTTFNLVWEQMQEELVHVSGFGKQVIAKNSSHYIQIDRPELVIEEVHKIVNHTREHAGASVHRRKRHELRKAIYITY